MQSVHSYKLGYRADLEGLRALAVVLVVGAHARIPGMEGGFIGVDLFFVLSGYLITGLLLDEISHSGRFDFVRFYARRFRRLTPALLTMLLLVALLTTALLAPGEQSEQAVTAMSATLWISNFHFALSKLDYFGVDASSNLFLHTWSLGVEEQFYLLWPLLLVVGMAVGARARGDRARRRYWFGVGLLGLALCGFVANLMATALRPGWAFYLMPFRAWQFAAGGLLWWLAWRRREKAASHGGALNPALWLGWLGLAAVLIAAVSYNAAVAYPGWRALVPTLGAVSIIAAGSLDRSSTLARIMAAAPLQWLGRRSYSWYLWHWPILLLGGNLWPGLETAGRLALAVAALLPAALSYRWIELPLRDRVAPKALPRTVVLAAFVSMAVALIGLLGWRALDLRRDAALTPYLQVRNDLPSIYAGRCDQWYYSAAVHVCAFGPADAPHTAVLFGDSVLAQWFPAIQRTYAQPGWRLLVLTKSACPLVDRPLFYARIGREYVECQQWREEALRRIAEWKPQVVVMGSAATYDFDAEQWRQGSGTVLRQLAAAADRVVLLRGTPRLPMDGPSCLAARGWLRQALRGDAACAGRDGAARDELVWNALRQAVAEVPRVSVLDLDGLVCPGGICQAERAGHVVFRDNQHLTAHFVDSLDEEVSRRLWSLAPGQADGRGGS